MKIAPPNSQSLNDWLSYLESIHPSEIELGLARVKAVAIKLGLLEQLGKTILVGGTNGKGSTCAYIEQLLLAAGKTTGVFSSPHLIVYNERLRINGEQLPDEQHVEAIQFIDQGRGDTSLTYFEFNTLAALYLMKKAAVDYFVLEVGLGGRLDSTNIVDADMAIITTIDLDHQAWLGTTREAVAYEKAGIFREQQLVICGEPNPPEPLKNRAQELNCEIQFKGHDFDFRLGLDSCWEFRGQSNYQHLPNTRLPMTNAATALAAFDAIAQRDNLSLAQRDICKVIASTGLAGRLQSIATSPEIVLDVAHNPQAGSYLASWLNKQGKKRVHCVCAMLSDKDSQATLQVVDNQVSHWYFASLDCPRGAQADSLAQSIEEKKVVGCFDTVNLALSAAKEQAHPEDIILVFGSFFTVSEVLTHTS